MDFLFSNYPPVRTGFKTFSDVFYDLLPESSALEIAVGYVSTDSLAELQKMVEYNQNIRKLNLVVGMHYFEKFTKVQYNAAMQLNEFLTGENLGEVRLVTAFRYHGKLYSYSNGNGPFAGIIGSNNLGSIVDGGVRTYESSLLLRDASVAKQMNEFIHELTISASKNIAELEIDSFNAENPVLDGQDGVEKLTNEKVIEARLHLSNQVSYDIPVKTEAKSNLNCYFGKGRENMRTHLVKPRHWYEAEIIVPMTIRANEGYPKGRPKTEPATEFYVITDDCYSFKCQVNGGEEGLWNKNLRSSGDLTILGKWVKGRLENAGVLKTGEPVTEETLRKYGRNTISMTKIDGTDDHWYFDFGV